MVLNKKPAVISPYGNAVLRAGAFRAKNPDTVLGDTGLIEITSAQLLALNATPVTVIAAPGTGKAIVPARTQFYKPAGTAYAGIAVGEDLALRYTNGSGTILQVVETTSFLDQATAQYRIVRGLQSAAATSLTEFTPTANAPLVAHLLAGEITTGDTSLYLRIWYYVEDLIS